MYFLIELAHVGTYHICEHMMNAYTSLCLPSCVIGLSLILNISLSNLPVL